MKHVQYSVDVLDNEGRITGNKPRYLIDKRVDIFHGVHVVLMTPEGQVVLSTIPERQDLPNLYAGMLGTTMATIRHHGETASGAARRGLVQELSIERAELVRLCGGIVTLADGRRNYLTGYVLVAGEPGLYQRLHIGELTLMEPEGLSLAMTMHPDRFAPTLRALWPSLEAWLRAR